MDELGKEICGKCLMNINHHVAHDNHTCDMIQQLTSKFRERLSAMEVDYKNEIEAVRSHARHELEMNFESLHKRLVNLEKRIDKLENHFSGDYQLVVTKVNRNKCPVCFSQEHTKLKVKDKGDNHSEMVIDCHACGSKGIIWG